MKELNRNPISGFSINFGRKSGPLGPLAIRDKIQIYAVFCYRTSPKNTGINWGIFALKYIKKMVYSIYTQPRKFREGSKLHSYLAHKRPELISRDAIVYSLQLVSIFLGFIHIHSVSF